MANTTAVYARIDTQLKNDAESILNQLGITPTVMIQMLYRQIVIQRRVPFEISLPIEKPLSLGEMSKDRLFMEVQKAIDSINEGKGYTPDEVDEILEREFGI